MARDFESLSAVHKVVSCLHNKHRSRDAGITSA